MNTLNLLEFNADSNIREWYHTAYPTDDYYTEINPNFTFNDLFYALDAYKDIYAEMFINNGGDSLVRERCFHKLADIMGVDYDYIYSQWLKCA
jgi:hypothetical protein